MLAVGDRDYVYMHKIFPFLHYTGKKDNIPSKEWLMKESILIHMQL